MFYNIYHLFIHRYVVSSFTVSHYQYIAGQIITAVTSTAERRSSVSSNPGTALESLGPRAAC